MATLRSLRSGARCLLPGFRAARAFSQAPVRSRERFPDDPSHSNSQSETPATRPAAATRPVAPWDQIKRWLTQYPSPTGAGAQGAPSEGQGGSGTLRRLGAQWAKQVDLEALRQNPRLWVKLAAGGLNQVTGYHQIEQLKAAVFQQETEFVKARRALDAAKLAHTEAVNRRAEGQREINNLLQRKHLWIDADVTRFTELYRSEHANEQAEAQAKRVYEEQEKAVDRKYTDLVDAIRVRYHEEQLWSDKIRAAATYGTWAVLGLNLVVFVFVHVVIEPRKRRKILDHVEQVVDRANQDLCHDIQTRPPQWWESAANRLQLSLLTGPDNRSTGAPVPAAAVVPPDTPSTPEPVAEAAAVVHDTIDPETKVVHSRVGPEVDGADLVPDEVVSGIALSPVESSPVAPEALPRTYSQDDVIRHACESAIVSCVLTAVITVWLGR
ncbi:sensitivity to high expression protein she9 [Tieghemiomyces parasiticus]|uniref:Sensitive to high expression protein 9, mitochondrial n=1 Tax=Tieghemiomyces parasiticus TaxID=78921 RepID=A0A9W7ZJU7_9FUNG|nr:sensitivity to high expression protein she9 [Tieghemiomyces parasiticus]